MVRKRGPDSGTESYTAESSVAEEDEEEEESEHSEDSAAACDSDVHNKCNSRKKLVQHDDDKVAIPEQDDVPGPSGDAAIYDTKQSSLLPSILRRESSSSISSRKVSFPMDESALASYFEPANDTSWTISTYLPTEELLHVYQQSCKQYKTIELDVIKNVITDIKNNTNHSATLNLSTLSITNEVNETIEDLLKVTNFRTLVLNECKFTSETISEFFNMLEYYESVCEIEVSMNFDEIAWKCFCSACQHIAVLEALSFRGMVINDNYMRMLLNTVKTNRRIITLKFDSCNLVKLPSFYLVENLMTNTTLCELYLPSTGLYKKEADCLGRFLQHNNHLKVLDISNNVIGDRGLEALSRGLSKQSTSSGHGLGLSVLVVFNNQLTEKCGPSIANILIHCNSLHTLNIGYNNLTDDVISTIAPSLEATTSLEGLGLQCTLLTCKGVDVLAKAIQKNKSLQKINLRGNKAIQVAGLEVLCQALTSTKIFRIEIDETNRSANDPEAYLQLVKKMKGISTVNKTFRESSNDEVLSLVSRKVSLSCEPRFINVDLYAAESPNVTTQTVTKLIPRSSTKSRFQITKVQDQKCPVSRFIVTKVISSTDEEELSSKFSNLRSSVSSTESVDSLQPDIDSD